jgi:hypothetical protein
LRYLFGYTVFDLQEEYLTSGMLDGLIERWKASGRRVLLAMGPNGVRQPFSDWSIKPMSGFRLDSRVLESSYTHFPTQVQRQVLDLDVYDVSAGESKPTSELYIDIGTSDNLYLGQGWYGKEQIPDGTTMRWTSGEAQVVLPNNFSGAGVIDLSFRLAAGSNSEPAPKEVKIAYCVSNERCQHAADASVISIWQVGMAFSEFEASVQTALEGPLAFWLETDTWNPGRTGISSDTRDLGVMVDWVRVRRGQ